MNRRDFVKFLALISAGVAARPDQIAAFEQYYDANTPAVERPLVAVDEIYLCGMAPRSTRLRTTFFPDAQAMHLGLNAFGGAMRWLAAPDQKIILRRHHVAWDIESEDASDTAPLDSILIGHISYIDQAKIRRNLQIRDWHGSL